MKLGFSKPTRDAEEQRALFAQFGAAGFDGLQLKFGQYREYLTDPSRFRDAWSAFPGVTAGLIIGGGALDDAGIANLRAVIHFAHAVGSERIVYWPGDPQQNPANEAFGVFAHTLAELGKEAQQAGARLSLHHHYRQIVMTRADLDRFFALVGDSAVGLTVDTAHLAKSGVTDVAAVIRDFHPFLDTIHMKDFADGEWRVLGEGNIAFGPIFAAIHESDFAGWLCADEESGSELRAGMDACYRFLTAGLAS